MLIKYAGFWHEIERQHVVFENDYKCTTATYTLFNASAVSVLNQSINKYKWSLFLFTYKIYEFWICFERKTGQPETGTGYAMAPDPTKPNQLLVHFTTNPKPGKYDVRTDFI